MESVLNAEPRLTGLCDESRKTYPIFKIEVIGHGGPGMPIDNALQNLNDKIKRCHQCRLAKTRLNVLCGEGHLRADLMLIAQAPGEHEDREGRMFIGPSGRVLDELLAMVDIQRGEVYMTNLIKCMLPKNRKPKSDEIASCGPFLDREIVLIGSKILAPLGYYAARFILEKYGFQVPAKYEFHNLYGELLKVDDKKIIPLQHPAAVLHNTSIKRAMVRNYRKLRVLLRS
jgi:DNA polymerase